VTLPVTRLGAGAQEVWVLWPAGKARSVVVFGHGWSTPFPANFGPWIAHLRALGSIVVYPRYRVSPDASTTSALAAFQTGIRSGFKRIGHLRLPVVAVGKSFGGSAIFYYAALARAWHVPPPVAVLSIFPALPLGAFPPLALAKDVYVEFFVGDADTTAGSGGANAFWSWLASHPSSEKRYVVIRSRPGFVANHDSAQRSDPIARAVFWRPLDLLVARARATHAHG
jgi:acetyl esterase/lipase